MKTLIIFAALVALSRAVLHQKPLFKADEPTQNQFMDCFDYANQGGYSFRFTDYAPTLNQNNFDNRISSCCFNGIWILYEQEQYNTGLQSAVFNGWGENYCVNLDSAMDNKASSVRFSGAPDGYKYDTINLYEGDYFMGMEQFLYDDAYQMNYDNFGRSMIVTGCSPWTAYQYDNFQGYSKCFYPSDTQQCHPAFFTSQDLGSMDRQISSLRRGCFSKDIVRGKALFGDSADSKPQQYSVFF